MVPAGNILITEEGFQKKKAPILRRRKFMDTETAKKLLKETKREELIQMITSMANSSEEAEEWFLDYCHKTGKNKEESLLVQEQISHYWGIAWDIIDDANTYGGTRRESEGYDALYKINELAESCDLPWEFKKRIVDGMMEQFRYGNSGFEDSLIESCRYLCKRGEEKLYLADQLSKSSSHFYRNDAADLYLECGEGEKFKALQKENLEYAEDYIRLAEYYKSKGMREEAIRFAEEAIDSAEGRMDELYTWLFKEYEASGQEEKILQLYKKAKKKYRNFDTLTSLLYAHYRDDYEKKKPYLLETAESCADREAGKWYEECKNVLKAEDFREVQDHLLQLLKKKDLGTYLKTRIEEGHPEDALASLRDNAGRQMYWYDDPDRDHEISRLLIKDYPEEIAEMYWKECGGLCLSSNKSNYAHAVVILKELRELCAHYDLEEEWNRRFHAFLEEHRRKRLLMQYIQLQSDLK